ncbi:MAG: pantoate--beta-alanine ligase [Candidatus Omnitrophica bacterium]|nr:pantoate--beta-alanine ligase [Candidatus Omnitrophota bacterium]
MKVIRSPQRLQKILDGERLRKKKVGFVPTMGALHEGHLSLVRAAARENDVTVVSIFVNPAQFGPHEDYTKYPRAPGADKRFLQKEKVDYLFSPSVSRIYPRDHATHVTVGPELAEVLCGKFRPGHFQGVATVVAKLLNIVGPNRLYMGAKDYQQAAVIRRLIRDLHMNVKLRVMPTVRERDGLALSSRNRYLNAEERRRALALSHALFEFRRNILKKKGTLAFLRAQAVDDLRKTVDRVQYFEVVDPVTFAPLRKVRRKMAVLTACFVGKTRLIDNVIITLP